MKCIGSNMKAVTPNVTVFGWEIRDKCSPLVQVVAKRCILIGLQQEQKRQKQKSGCILHLFWFLYVFVLSTLSIDKSVKKKKEKRKRRKQTLQCLPLLLQCGCGGVFFSLGKELKWQSWSPRLRSKNSRPPQEAQNPFWNEKLSKRRTERYATVQTLHSLKTGVGWRSLVPNSQQIPFFVHFLSVFFLKDVVVVSKKPHSCAVMLQSSKLKQKGKGKYNVTTGKSLHHQHMEKKRLVLYYLRFIGNTPWYAKSCLQFSDASVLWYGVASDSIIHCINQASMNMAWTLQIAVAATAWRGHEETEGNAGVGGVGWGG